MEDKRVWILTFHAFSVTAPNGPSLLSARFWAGPLHRGLWANVFLHFNECACLYIKEKHKEKKYIKYYL